MEIAKVRREIWECRECGLKCRIEILINGCETPSGFKAYTNVCICDIEDMGNTHKSSQMWKLVDSKYYCDCTNENRGKRKVLICEECDKEILE